MLLEFKATNYKSFKEEFVFSMIPAPKLKGLDYSVLKTKVGKKQYNALCSAVVYGPNASGKSNIIGAMDVFRSIVLRGNVRNSADIKNEPNHAAVFLELIPNNTLDQSAPVQFSITFIEKGFHIEYALSVKIGKFMQEVKKRKILSETLKINDSLIFSRGNGLDFGSLEVIKEFLISEFGQNEAAVKLISERNLDGEELFLINGFKAMFSSSLVSLITGWLENKFRTIYRADTMRLMPDVRSFEGSSKLFIDFISEVMRCFGVTSSEIGYVANKDDNDARLVSFVKWGNREKALPAAMFESHGTIRFINLIPLIAEILLSGGTLVVDEFDASIHPMALMSIINIFHNDEINIYRAQLIFNTHNPIFLNKNLFRRDEIKFVERDDESHNSSLYALSDFGTAGKRGVRNNDDYMKNYFIDRYGAIKDIDFAPHFEELMNNNNEV